MQGSDDMLGSGVSNAEVLRPFVGYDDLTPLWVDSPFAFTEAGRVLCEPDPFLTGMIILLTTVVLLALTGGVLLWKRR